MSSVLEIRGVSHQFGANGSGRVIDDLSFSVEKGQFVTIVGPSGTGKTTLLRIVSGLLRPSGGSVTFEGRSVAGEVPPGLAVVFQDYSRSLFPWLSVSANVDLPLSVLDCDAPERRERVAESLAAVALSDYASHYPWQLSGGMQQRVAIARALASRPDLLVMDEPFASLDALTRANLEDLLLSVRERFNTTILFVTHDIDESIYLSDRVLVLSPRPAHLLADWPVELARPRHQVRTRQEPAFVARRAQVAELIWSGGEAKPP